MIKYIIQFAGKLSLIILCTIHTMDVPFPDKTVNTPFEKIVEIKDLTDIENTKSYFFNIKDASEICLLTLLQQTSGNVQTTLTIVDLSKKSYTKNIITRGTALLKDTNIHQCQYGIKNNDEYTFFIVTQTTNNNKKKDYWIKSITYTSNSQEIEINNLFKHTNSVIHMSIVNHNNKQYLVTGSTYPAIHIYDIENKKIIQTLHNRFLLGCIHNNIVYAKMNERPILGIGRFWDNYAKKKPIVCTVHYLQDSLDKNTEQELKYSNELFSIIIDKNKYPVITEGNNSIIFSYEGKIHIITKGLQVDIINTFISQSSKQPDYLSYNTNLQLFFKNQNELLINDKGLFYDAFNLFYNKLTNQQINALPDNNDLINNRLRTKKNFLAYYIYKTLENSTTIDKQYAKVLAQIIADKYYLNNKSKNNNFKQRIEALFQAIQSLVESEIPSIHSQSRSFLQKSILLANVVKVEHNTIAYANNQAVISTKNSISITNNTPESETVSTIQLSDNNEKIERVFAIDNEFYCLNKNFETKAYGITNININSMQESFNIKMHQYDIVEDFLTVTNQSEQSTHESTQQTTQDLLPKNIAETPMEFTQIPITSSSQTSTQISEAQVQEMFNKIKVIISSDKFIQEVIEKINDKNTFDIKDITSTLANDIQNTAPRLNGILTNAFITYYISPILSDVMDQDNELQRLLSNNKEAKEKLIAILTASDIWFKGIKTQTIENFLINKKEFYSSEISISADQFNQRFTISSDVSLDENLKRRFWYLYQVETQKTTITETTTGFFIDTTTTLLNNQTPFSFYKNEFIKNANNIKEALNEKDSKNKMMHALQKGPLE